MKKKNCATKPRSTEDGKDKIWHSVRDSLISTWTLAPCDACRSVTEWPCREVPWVVNSWKTLHQNSWRLSFRAIIGKHYQTSAHDPWSARHRPSLPRLLHHQPALAHHHHLHLALQHLNLLVRQERDERSHPPVDQPHHV